MIPYELNTYQVGIINDDGYIIIHCNEHSHPGLKEFMTVPRDEFGFPSLEALNQKIKIISETYVPGLWTMIMDEFYLCAFTSLESMFRFCRQNRYIPEHIIVPDGAKKLLKFEVVSL